MTLFGRRWPAMMAIDAEDMFQEWFRDTAKYVSPNGYFPKFDQFVDEEGDLQIKIALAGYPKESLHITACDDELTIEADKVTDEDYGSFARRGFKETFVNSKGIWNLAEADVLYKDGMLSITIHPKQEKKKKELKIK